MKKTMIAVAAGLAIAGAGIGAATLMPQSSNEKTAQSAETLQTASFAVENMTCATCPVAQVIFSTAKLAVCSVSAL